MLLYLLKNRDEWENFKNDQKHEYCDRYSNPFEDSPRDYPCLVGLEEYRSLGDCYTTRYRLAVYDISDYDIREFVDIIKKKDLRDKIYGTR